MAPDPAASPVRLAGVDGCRGGWLACLVAAEGPLEPEIRLVATFADLLDGPAAPAIVAVDMPIGLPERVGAGGRGPETLVRPLLGERRSSVFSIPARAAVWVGDGLPEPDAWRLTCETALATSTPPRKVSKQGFNLFPKIRELDRLMTPQLARRIFESHPELAFRELGDGRPMRFPKKPKDHPRSRGLDERRDLLEALGFDRALLDARPPRGAAPDDLLDACVLALVARRIAEGRARSWPETPTRDPRGLPIAIHA